MLILKWNALVVVLASPGLRIDKIRFQVLISKLGHWKQKIMTYYINWSSYLVESENENLNNQYSRTSLTLTSISIILLYLEFKKKKSAQI